MKADPKNPFSLAGLGEVYLRKKDFPKARRYFSHALKQKDSLSSALLGLAQVEFRLENFRKAKVLFMRYQNLKPLEPQSYYFLGRIYEKERNFGKAATQYQHAMRTGQNDIDIILRLLRIGLRVETKRDIINFAFTRYNEFKKEFSRARMAGLKGKAKGLKGLKKRMLFLEKMIKKYTVFLLTNRAF